MFPASAGRFLTTGPSGKSQLNLNYCHRPKKKIESPHLDLHVSGKLIYDRGGITNQYKKDELVNKWCWDICLHKWKTKISITPLDFLSHFFLGGSDCKESACNAGDLGRIPGWGRSPGEGNGSPLHYSCLGNPMDGGAWRVTVHGVTQSQTQLSD